MRNLGKKYTYEVVDEETIFVAFRLSSAVDNFNFLMIEVH